MTAARVTNLYDLMDSAYDVPEIRAHSRSLGHVPIIDINPRSTPGLKEELKAEKRRCQRLSHRPAEEIRYNERTTVERVNGRIKDEFGGRTVRVRGLMQRQTTAGNPGRGQHVSASCGAKIQRYVPVQGNT